METDLVRQGYYVHVCCVYQSNIWKPMPSIIFGTMAVVAGSVTFLLPETLKTKLPETIEEAEAFGKWVDIYYIF